MARRALPAVAQDFAAVLTFLQSRGIVPSSPPAPMVEDAKRIHRATYSLILWRFRLRQLPEHSMVFIEEIASDALQILPQALMGYSKTTKLVTRGIVENVLRHIYFADHPIEFERMNRERKWFMTMESLFEYAKIHPTFTATETHFDALTRLRTLYSDLSAGVHGSKVRDLEMRIALNRIKYVQAAVHAEMLLVERCAESVNFLLAAFNQEKMDRFSLEDQRVILRTMPPRARQVWKAL
jgi:hypothetical protein